MLRSLQRPLQSIQKQKLPYSLSLKLDPSGEAPEQSRGNRRISWELFSCMGWYALNNHRVGREAIVTADSPVFGLQNRHENGGEP